MTMASKEEILAKFSEGAQVLKTVKIPHDSPHEFVQNVFESEKVADLLIFLSRLPVFEKEFSMALSHDLELLALAKKLKFFTNLPLGQNLLLLQGVLQRFETSLPAYDSALINIVAKHGKLSSIRFKDYVKSKDSLLANAARYVENNVELESIDPHAVYPTSIYRHCDGLTLATADSQTIEAVMSTTLTTTIKITSNVLDPSNRILADL